MAETLSPILHAATEARLDAILGLLSHAEVKLATAESCTGGILASLFTDIPGRSHVFEAGFVTYSDEAKSRMLGIPLDFIAEHGAVSEAVAKAMVAGVLARSAADLAVSVTGFAGPGRSQDEAGLVHFACGWRDGAPTHAKHHFGTRDRGETRLCCIDAALDLLEAALRGRGSGQSTGTTDD